MGRTNISTASFISLMTFSELRCWLDCIIYKKFCQTYISKIETIYRPSRSYSLGDCSYQLVVALLPGGKGEGSVIMLKRFNNFAVLAIFLFQKR